MSQYLEPDSTQHERLDIHQFDQTIVQEFKADERFQYIQPPGSRPNWLKIMFQRLLNWLILILGDEGLAWMVLFVFIIIGLVGLAFGAYGIFGIGKTIPVFLDEEGGLEYKVETENIHEINFQEEIDMAVQQKDFKRAIRLLYLFTLKLFTDEKMIEWRPSKTNYDYLYELQTQRVKSDFEKVSYIFEYVWYGNFQADNRHYVDMRDAFSDLKKQIVNGERN
jgi:hypothetical protein